MAGLLQNKGIQHALVRERLASGRLCVCILDIYVCVFACAESVPVSFVKHWKGYAVEDKAFEYVVEIAPEKPSAENVIKSPIPPFSIFSKIWHTHMLRCSLGFLCVQRHKLGPASLTSSQLVIQHVHSRCYTSLLISSGWGGVGWEGEEEQEYKSFCLCKASLLAPENAKGLEHRGNNSCTQGSVHTSFAQVVLCLLPGHLPR